MIRREIYISPFFIAVILVCKLKNYEMSDAYKISFIEGDLMTLKITVPVELDMTDRIAKVQVRREPKAPLKFEFATNDDSGMFVLSGQEIAWVIPGFLSVGKSGIYQWEIVIYKNATDPVRFARGLFEIIPQLAEV